MTRRILAVLAYIVPTFPLGYFWHLTIFASHYKALDVYRDEIVIPLGFASMVIQGIVWSLLYERLFAGEPVHGACRSGEASHVIGERISRDRDGLRARPLRDR
jgi:hypothetical protein